MKLILCGILVVAWWFALWELANLVIEDWTREQKVWLYVTMLIILSVILVAFPKHIRVV